MTSTASSNNPAKLFDNVWHCPEGLESQKGFRMGKWADVQKLTIGSLGTRLYEAGLSRHMTSPGALTHLYLWFLTNLAALPWRLPTTLRHLDLRGCESLRLLDGKLPPHLEALDLSGCTSLRALPLLPVGLRRLHLDDCFSLGGEEQRGALHLDLSRLRHLEVFSARNCKNLLSLQLPKQQPTLPLSVNREIKAGVRHATNPGFRLKRIVLDGCAQLSVIPEIRCYPWLQQLSLENCEGLTVLPRLPRSLQHLTIHGCTALTRTRAEGTAEVGLGPRDRGLPGENVAPYLLSMQKFGGELALIARTKLILLGDGRAGKSTLSDALRWWDLKPEERQTPTAAQQTFRPDRNKRSTVGVQCLSWNTTAHIEDKKSRDRFADFAPPESRDALKQFGVLPTQVQVWDFAGQEIYHGAHRLFVGEGSVFLIVWSTPDIMRQRREAELRGCSTEDRAFYARENQDRDVEYWLDYVSSLAWDRLARGGGATIRPMIRLICTGSHCDDQAKERTNWRALTGSYASRSDIDIDCFFVDLLNPQLDRDAEFQALVTWLRKALGAELTRQVPIKPRLYGDVARRLDVARIGHSDRTARAPAKLPQFLEFTSWTNLLHKWCRPPGQLTHAPLEAEDVGALTRWLHSAGDVFWNRNQKGPGAVVIDQRWTLERVYNLLTKRSVERQVREWDGKFDHDFLRNQVFGIENDDYAAMLSDFTMECRLAHRFQDGDYVALQDPFLPRLAEHSQSRAIELQWASGIDPIEAKVIGEVGNHVVGIGVFHVLTSRLLTIFGRKVEVWLNGLQFQSTVSKHFRSKYGGDQPGEVSYLFRARWIPDPRKPRSYRGWILMEIKCRQSQVAFHTLRELLNERGANNELVGLPWKPFDESQRTQLEALQAFAAREYAGQHDVGISSASDVEGSAQRLFDALQTKLGHDFHVFWYKKRNPQAQLLGTHDEVVRQLEGRRPAFTALARSRILIVVLSPRYFHSWYCMKEFADSILAATGGEPQVGVGPRSRNRLIILAPQDDDSFRFSDLNALLEQSLKIQSEALEKMWQRLIIGGSDPALHMSIRQYASSLQFARTKLLEFMELYGPEAATAQRTAAVLGRLEGFASQIWELLIR